ncbi:MAG TPA: hypothetical protein VH413_12165 [Verrucomicrobiae bacterium]|jgi:hypothetical protein|nr:hypothetical protein [Verrucomicrobiae bacterium]
MADETTPTPGGAVPPKPPEASKVQPKKETVRINLPPKPSAAPTIKLPTLPPGGPTAPAPMPAAPAAAAAPAVARAGAAPVAPAAVQRPAPRPVVQQAAPALSGLDVGLAIAAAVAGLVAVGSTIYCMMLFT